MKRLDILWQHITIIQKFQFPWRFLSVVVFSGSVLGGMTMHYISSKKKRLIYCALWVIFSVLLSVPYIQTQSNVIRPESFYKEVYKGTTDTGESAPRWSVRFMEKQAESPVEVIDGDALVSNLSRNSTVRKYEVKADTDARIRENTLYFPNWEVFINGEKATIEYQDVSNRGLITYYVPAGTSQIEVVFNDTRLRTFANSISIAAILILVCIIFIPKKFTKYDK